MKNEIFKANPGLDVFFQTSDDECFFTESAAKNHAKNLSDKAVTPHHRSGFTDEEEELEEYENIETIVDTTDYKDSKNTGDQTNLTVVPGQAFGETQELFQTREGAKPIEVTQEPTQGVEAATPVEAAKPTEETQTAQITAPAAAANKSKHQNR